MMKRYLAACAALTLTLVACKSGPPSVKETMDRNSIQARWPISDFQGYDPYPPGYGGPIHAYVDFHRDGLLRVSLGCRQTGAPYQFLADGRLGLAEGATLSNPDYSQAECDPKLIEKEKRLVDFLASGPLIHKPNTSGLLLTHNRQELLLQAVSEVLGAGVTMKEVP